MFARVAIPLTKPAGFGAARGLASRMATQTRFLSKQANQGSKGRSMPETVSRATAPVANLDATLTIRVRLSPVPSLTRPAPASE